MRKQAGQAKHPGMVHANVSLKEPQVCVHVVREISAYAHDEKFEKVLEAGHPGEKYQS